MVYNTTYYKGGQKRMEENKSEKKKITLYLDTDSINYLKRYSLDILRTGSISEAVRVFCKEHEQRNKESN